METFYTKMSKGSNYTKTFDIFDNDNIVYAHGDFDEYLIKDEDKIVLNDWIKELKIEYHGKNYLDVFDKIQKKKRNPYTSLTNNELKFFNRASWLSLNRKGEILIDCFKTQFYPKIKKIHSVQKTSYYKNSFNDDVIVGIIDMVIDYEGFDKPIIFDLKTSGKPYTTEKIELTDQLMLYAAMEGVNYNTDLVGYVVLVKSIPKIFKHTCKVCNHVKGEKERHTTCNNNINGKRCMGKWIKKVELAPKVQVLIEQKTPQEVDDVLLDVSNIMKSMKNNIVYKNKEKCYNWFGSKCPYFDACHKNDTSNLIGKK